MYLQKVPFFVPPSVFVPADFAICVSKKLGNAVTRNKLKRQVKDIIDKSNLIFKSSNDYVIILKKEINELNYEQIKVSLINLISKILD